MVVGLTMAPVASAAGVARACCVVAWLALVGAGPALAEPSNLAPGFSTLPKGAKIVIMPPDIELFSVSAGGVTEPKAEWTQVAETYLHAAVNKNAERLGLQAQDIAENDLDELAEINALHGAVARSIALHHMGGGNLALPTKDNKLDWSLGTAVEPIRQKSGGDYALFIWIRDSYASAERKATMVLMALLGVGLTGGIQIGYASLVDLRSGQVMWFNRLGRGSGDLREPEAAGETVTALLKNFPGSQ